MRMLTIGEAARRLDLAVDTVRRLERDGILMAERTAGGHRRFREDVIAAYASGQRPPAKRVNLLRPQRRRRPAATEPATIFNDPLYRDEPVTDEDGYPEEDDYPEDGPDWDEDLGEVPTTRPDLPPPHWGVSNLQFEVPKMKQPVRSDEAAARLKRYKAHGVSCIPYDVPASWRGKVIAEVDTFVTASRFPDWVSDAEAR